MCQIKPQPYSVGSLPNAGSLPRGGYWRIFNRRRRFHQLLSDFHLPQANFTRRQANFTESAPALSLPAVSRGGKITTKFCILHFAFCIAPKVHHNRRRRFHQLLSDFHLPQANFTRHQANFTESAPALSLPAVSRGEVNGVSLTAAGTPNPNSFCILHFAFCIAPQALSFRIPHSAFRIHTFLNLVTSSLSPVSSPFSTKSTISEASPETKKRSSTFLTKPLLS